MTIDRPRPVDCIRMGPGTIREELLYQGVTEAGADELMDYMAYLKAKEAGEFDGNYEDWRSQEVEA